MNKNSIRKGLSLSLTAFVGALCALPLVGCGANNDPVKEDPAALAKRMDSAKALRTYFDRSQGNYAALSPEDKAAVDRLTGGAANSQVAFSHMGPSGSTGGATPSGLPPSGG